MRIVGYTGLALIVAAFFGIIFFPALSGSPAISNENALNVGVQLLHADGTVETFDKPGVYPLGKLYLAPELKWIYNNQEITKYRFRAEVSVTGQNLPANTLVNHAVYVTMKRYYWHQGWSAPREMFTKSLSVGDGTSTPWITPPGTEWKTNSQGQINERHICFASDQVDSIGYYGPNDESKASEAFWTSLGKPAEITSTGDYVKFTSEWRYTANVGDVSGEDTDTAEVKITYQAGALDVTLTIAPQGKLQLLSLIAVPLDTGKVFYVDSFFIILLTAGIAMAFIGAVKNW
jgi:hypothetical protein